MTDRKLEDNDPRCFGEWRQDGKRGTCARRIHCRRYTLRNAGDTFGRDYSSCLCWTHGQGCSGPYPLYIGPDVV